MKADPQRLHLPETGIYIRAKNGDRWESVDLAHLDKESAEEWLAGRAVQAALYLLGHER